MDDYRELALNAIAILCDSCLVNDKAMKSGDNALLIANHTATASVTSKLCKDLERLEGDHESIRDLADPLGVSVDG